MLVSVVTATYNRASTLPALATSLENQGTDVEWVVVDDGSTDDSAAVLTDLAGRTPFPVRTLRQPNRGKHVALNRGIPLARGEMLALLDSDDELLPGALARLCEHWRDIPAGRRDGFVGVTGRCVDERGRRIGNDFPGGRVDCSWQEAVYVHHCAGERFGILRADVLREHPFPEPPDRSFVVESVLWRRIGRRYLTRYVDDPVRVYHTAGHDRISRQPFVHRAAALHDFYVTVLGEDLPWFRHAPMLFLRAAAHCARAGLHQRMSLPRQLAPLSPAARLLWSAALPLGAALWLRDRVAAGAAPASPRRA